MPEQRKVQGEHQSGTHRQPQHQQQHRQHLHNPTGYTDEVADEEREFMMQAERSAGIDNSQSSGGNMKGQKGGLGSSQQQSSSGMGSNMGQKAGSTMENMKNKAKDTMNMK